MLSAFSGCRFLVCCEKGREGEVSSLLPQATVFSPQAFAAAAGIEGTKRDNSIGHARNAIQLASLCLDPQAGLVLLDDDIIAGGHARAAFERAFVKYDLVQGSYASGYSGNKIYALVYFFDLLSSLEDRAGEDARVERALRGAVEIPQVGNEGLHSLAGGLAGISCALKAKNPFAPTHYLFEDHFYEFSSRYLFRPMRFMGYGTSPGDIPPAIHNRQLSGSAGKLVDDFVQGVRSAVVESYFYFRLSGAVPKLAGGRHALVRTESFAAGEAAGRAMEEAAVEKFRQAAAFHSQRFGGQAREQLERIARLSPDDFLVPQQELEQEWECFREEREWLQHAAARCRSNGSEIFAGLAGGT